MLPCKHLITLWDLLFYVSATNHISSQQEQQLRVTESLNTAPPSNIIYTIPFKHFKSYTIPFSKEDLCKDENLSEVWKTDVEDVFASHGLSCTLKWNEGAMTMAETENTCYGQVVDNCFHALLTITCGLRAEWVEPIVSGTVAADAFRLWAPVGLSEC